MSTRNKLLESIVLALGGTVTNPNNRNQLLYDWLTAKGGVPPQTRYVYNFNSVDNYIETGQRIVDVDNLDGLILEGYFDSGIAGTMFSQSTSQTVTEREFQIYTFADNSTNNMFLIAGGTNVEILSSLDMPSEAGTYKFVFVSGGVVNVYFNGELANSASYSVGAAREPASTFKIMARGAGVDAVGYFRSGFCYNVKINDGSVYNYPINDRTFGAGAVIANTGTGPDATGANLLESGWEEITL